MKKPLSEIFPNVPEGLDLGALDAGNIPAHVAVIMDGNGRWAKQRALNRLRGHKAGIEAVRETIRCANDLGVRFLTIYSFSTENWNRPKDEIDGLMSLFAKTMLAEVDELHAERVRVKTIGDISALPQETREAFEKAWELTRENEGMTLLVAVNYGGRAEIVHAVNKWLSKMNESGEQGASKELGASGEQGASKELGASGEQGASKELGAFGEQGGLEKPKASSDAPEMTEEALAQHLYTEGIPDPELLIRTSGEMRISNFMLWQIAYSEFVVSDVLWPDFDRYEFLRCLLDYQQRSRRFGGVA